MAIGYSTETSNNKSTVYFGFENNELHKNSMPIFEYMACYIAINITTESFFDFTTKVCVPSLKNLAAAKALECKLSKESLPRDMQTFLNDYDFNLVQYENIVLLK